MIRESIPFIYHSSLQNCCCMCFGVTLLIIYVSLLLTLFFMVFFFFFLQYIPRTEDHVLGIVVDYKADVSLLKSLLA